jgi:rhamnosyltransferase subunit B
VHPFIGIAQALHRRGNDVTVVASEPFGPLVRQSGLNFVEYLSEREYRQVIEDPDLWHPRKGTYLILRTLSGHLRRAYSRLSEIVDPDRTVFVNHTLSFPARLYAEKHHVREATLHLQPATFRSVMQPATFIPGRDLSWMPTRLTRLMWWVIDRMIDRHMLPALNALRGDLDLPFTSRVLKNCIHSTQCTVGLFPEWFAPPAPDWPATARLTGFPLFDATDHHELSPGLEAFLSAGDPPLVFTPGTAHTRADRFFQAAVEAASRLGRRAVLLTRFAEHLPEELPAHVYRESYVPFSRLLPRCAAIVHHGGIGTCAQGLAAGLPQLTMPMGFDQPDNVTHLHRLGVASWITPRKFTGERVARALGRLLENRQVADACARWRDQIAASDPVARTCEILEEVRSGK